MAFFPRGNSTPATRHKGLDFTPATELQKENFLRRRRQGLTAGEAKLKSEMTWAQLKYALASDQAFADGVEEVEEFFIDKVEDVAEAMAIARDGPMVRFVLERRRPEKWGKQATIKVTHSIESADQVRAMSDEDIEAQFEILKGEIGP